MTTGKNSIVLFDFGASILSSKVDHKAIIDQHTDIFEKGKELYLVISHWDADHYNLLCLLGDDYLKKIRKAIFSSEIKGESALQIAERLKNIVNHTSAYLLNPDIKHLGRLA